MVMLHFDPVQVVLPGKNSAVDTLELELDDS